MRLPILIENHNRWQRLSLGCLAMAAGYFLTNRFQLSDPKVLPLGPIGQAIPFLPWTVFVYLTHMPMYLSPYFSEREAKNLNPYLYALIADIVISCSIFFIFPTQFPRDAGTFSQLSGLTGLAFELIYAFDQPNNCFPSFHVSLVFLASFYWIGKSQLKFALYFFWAVLVAISTLTTRQHFLIDVCGGYAMAWLLYRFFFHRRVQYDHRRYERECRHTLRHDEHRSARYLYRRKWND